MSAPLTAQDKQFIQRGHHWYFFKKLFEQHHIEHVDDRIAVLEQASLLMKHGWEPAKALNFTIDKWKKDNGVVWGAS